MEEYSAAHRGQGAICPTLTTGSMASHRQVDIAGVEAHDFVRVFRLSNFQENPHLAILDSLLLLPSCASDAGCWRSGSSAISTCILSCCAHRIGLEPTMPVTQRIRPREVSVRRGNVDFHDHQT